MLQERAYKKGKKTIQKSIMRGLKTGSHLFALNHLAEPVCAEALEKDRSTNPQNIEICLLDSPVTGTCILPSSRLIEEGS
jgi:hypothetical protein